MAFSIYGNSSATQAYNSLLTTTNATQKAQLELASGKSINSAADNTSGFRVSSELQTKISLMNSASANVSNAAKLVSNW